jgi:hypothetical protein
VRQADGELVISSATPTFIALYTTAARAARIEPALRRSDPGRASCSSVAAR